MNWKRGINLGGWFSHYYDPPSLWPGHHETFFCREDVERIRQRGFDHVRLPLDWRVIEHRLETLEEALGWFVDADLGIQLNLHHGPGTEFTEEQREQDFFRSAQIRETYLSHILALVTRFRGIPHLAFEPFNELFCSTHDQLNEIQNAFVARLRQECDEPIILTSNAYGSPATFSHLVPAEAAQVFYAFHFYGPLSFTHQKAPWVKWKNMSRTRHYPGDYEMQPPQLCGSQEGGYWDKKRLAKEISPVLEFRDRYQVPILCNEWGVIDYAPPESSTRWVSDCLELFEKNKIGWTYWNYRSCQFGVDENPAIFDLLEESAHAPL